ncbi:hypothetical protein [Jiulongibacter sp. NS-SX5]|uniref:hypothetical protein n=1 Tax=Jiulongibacter sp. NS-SX5 TaxID=3463854 RepID=UPI00405A391C
MVSKSNIDLLIGLAESPQSVTPFDFQILSDLLDQYPDFDFLRMVFVSAGEKLGAKGAAFEAERQKWLLKAKLIQSKQENVKTESKPKENLTYIERVDRFLKNFQPVHRPENLFFERSSEIN